MAITSTKATFVKEGKTLDITAAAAISCGDIKIVDGCTCIALWDIAQGESSTLKVLHKGEVVRIATNEAIGETNAGVAVYVTSAGLVTKTAEGNTLLGYTAKAVAAADLTFEVVCA